MKKVLFLMVGILGISSVSYSAPQKSLAESLNAIEAKFNDLLEKEAQKKREFEAQKAQLEAEVEDLKSKEQGKEKVFEKLKKDSEVRWFRDKYKQVLNNYDTYYKNIAKMIREKEQKISELEAMLSVMN
ncbi:MAG: adhesion protein FadA [Leptotrichiaceae bacterium]|nr:adhesion protein FadA [Leptotrichiaceae bacterium]